MKTTLRCTELERRYTLSSDVGNGYVQLQYAVLKPFEDFNGGLTTYDVTVDGVVTKTYIAAQAPGGPRVAVVDSMGNRLVGDYFAGDPTARSGAVLIPVESGESESLRQQLLDTQHLLNDYVQLGTYGVRQVYGPALTLTQADSMLSDLSHESAAYTFAFIKQNGVTDIVNGPLTKDPIVASLSGINVPQYIATGGPTLPYDEIGGLANNQTAIFAPGGKGGSASIILHERSHVVDFINGMLSSQADFQAVRKASPAVGSYYVTYSVEDWAESNTKYLMGELTDPVRLSYFDNLYATKGWK